MFSSRLRKYRQLACLSQKQLAEKLYVSQQAVARWETDRATPNPETIAKIAKIFDISTDLLLVRDEKKEPTPDDEDGLSDKDLRLIAWFHSLPQEKRKAILMLGEAPEGLDE